MKRSFFSTLILFSSVFSIFFENGFSNDERLVFSSINEDRVFEFINQIFRNRQKISDQLGTIYIHSLQEKPDYTTFVENGIKETNVALGGSYFLQNNFNKIPSISSSFTKSGVNIFIGKDWQCRRVMRTFSKNQSFRMNSPWSTYWYYDSNKVIYSALIVINEDSMFIKESIVSSLLYILGYSRNADPIKLGTNKDFIKSFFYNKNPSSTLTSFDFAIIRFCETYLTDSKTTKKRSIVSENWPLFALNLDIEQH